MEGNMEVVKSFNSELASLYESQPPISKKKMMEITRSAMRAIKYYKHVVLSVEKFIQKCKDVYKVPGLYVIDSIVRQSQHQYTREKDVYAPRFARNLSLTFENLLKCSEEDKAKVVRVLNLWLKNGIFSHDVLRPLLTLASSHGLETDAIKVEKAVKGEDANVDLYSGEGDDSDSRKLRGSAKNESFEQETKKKSNQSGGTPTERRQQKAQNDDATAAAQSAVKALSAAGLQDFDPNLVQQIEQLTSTLLSQQRHQQQQPSITLEEKTVKKLLKNFEYSDDESDGGGGADDDDDPTKAEDVQAAATALMNNPLIMEQLAKLQQQSSSSDVKENAPPLAGAVAPVAAPVRFPPTQPVSQEPQPPGSVVMDFSRPPPGFDFSKPPPGFPLPPPAGVGVPPPIGQHGAPPPSTNQQHPPPPGVLHEPPPFGRTPPFYRPPFGSPPMMAPPPQEMSRRQFDEPKARGLPSAYDVDERRRSNRDRRERSRERDKDRSKDKEKDDKKHHKRKKRSRSTSRSREDSRSGRHHHKRRKRSRSRSKERSKRADEEEHDEKRRESSRRKHNNTKQQLEEPGTTIDAVDSKERSSFAELLPPLPPEEPLTAEDNTVSRRSSQPRAHSYDKEKERERRKKGLPSSIEGHVCICSRTLWLGRLPPVAEEDIRDMLREFGEPVAVTVVSNSGCAYATMADRKSAARVMDKLRSPTIQRKPIKMAYAQGKALKGSKFSDLFNHTTGVTYISWDRLSDSVNLNEFLTENFLDLHSLPPFMKGKYEKEVVDVEPLLQQTAVQHKAVLPRNSGSVFPETGSHTANIPMPPTADVSSTMPSVPLPPFPRPPMMPGPPGFPYPPPFMGVPPPQIAEMMQRMGGVRGPATPMTMRPPPPMPMPMSAPAVSSQHEHTPTPLVGSATPLRPPPFVPPNVLDALTDDSELQSGDGRSFRGRFDEGVRFGGRHTTFQQSPYRGGRGGDRGSFGRRGSFGDDRGGFRGRGDGGFSRPPHSNRWEDSGRGLSLPTSRDEAPAVEEAEDMDDTQKMMAAMGLPISLGVDKEEKYERERDERGGFDVRGRGFGRGGRGFQTGPVGFSGRARPYEPRRGGHVGVFGRGRGSADFNQYNAEFLPPPAELGFHSGGDEQVEPPATNDSEEAGPSGSNGEFRVDQIAGDEGVDAAGGGGDHRFVHSDEEPFLPHSEELSGEPAAVADDEFRMEGGEDVKIHQPVCSADTVGVEEQYDEGHDQRDVSTDMLLADGGQDDEIPQPVVCGADVEEENNEEQNQQDVSVDMFAPSP